MPTWSYAVSCSICGTTTDIFVTLPESWWSTFYLCTSCFADPGLQQRLTVLRVYIQRKREGKL